MQGSEKTAPPGQQWRQDMPRFGLPRFAKRVVSSKPDQGIDIAGLSAVPFNATAAMIDALPQITMSADFHCVTTWSVAGVTWQGVSFKAFYDALLATQDTPVTGLGFAAVHAHDEYRASFHLADLLQDNALLAVEMPNAKISTKHGVPFRLVMPDQYGYKNVKNVKRIEFLPDLRSYGHRGCGLWSIRARVAHEERARGIPGVLLWWPYRGMIRDTVATFEHEWHQNGGH